MVVFEQAEDAEGLETCERRFLSLCTCAGVGMRTSALWVSWPASWKKAAAWSCSSPAVAMLLLRVAVWALRTCSWALVRCADSMLCGAWGSQGRRVAESESFTVGASQCACAGAASAVWRCCSCLPGCGAVTGLRQLRSGGPTTGTGTWGHDERVEFLFQLWAVDDGLRPRSEPGMAASSRPVPAVCHAFLNIAIVVAVAIAFAVARSLAARPPRLSRAPT